MDHLSLNMFWMLDARELRRVISRSYKGIALYSCLLVFCLLWFSSGWSRHEPSLGLLGSIACFGLLITRALVRLRRARRYQQMRFLAMVQQGTDGQSRESPA